MQHVPCVKTMFGAVMKLKGACNQAVHNKERCTALVECVRWRSEHARALIDWFVRAAGVCVRGYWRLCARVCVGLCVCDCVCVSVRAY